MTRKNSRNVAVRLLYSQSFLDSENIDVFLGDFFAEEHYSSLQEEDELFNDGPNKKQIEYISTLLNKVRDHLPEIDSMIESNLAGWKVQRISKTALSVLRCAVCEMLYFDDIPVSVSINEAVEIAKNFDSEDIVSFINGVLGSISKQLTVE